MAGALTNVHKSAPPPDPTRCLPVPFHRPPLRVQSVRQKLLHAALSSIPNYSQDCIYT
ncbi:hypothetical protein BDZ91DRAFT_715830 [Kalaharituber pfeilii]|nr:hypothetical protein BDZ91DRAFT_715830 [Kalaharituber pfeilii]